MIMSGSTTTFYKQAEFVYFGGNHILRYDSDNGKIQPDWLPLTNLISESYSIIS